MYYFKVTCPKCSHHQTEEIHRLEEKFGWGCKSCEAKLEYWPAEKISKEHLLSKHGARFTTTQGGNVCTGFGGLPGEF